MPCQLRCHGTCKIVTWSAHYFSYCSNRYFTLIELDYELIKLLWKAPCCFSTKASATTILINTWLTHCGRVTHICVSKLTIIGSDNGLSPGRRQAIIWTNAGILLIRTLGTNFSEILRAIHAFLFKKMHLQMSSAKWRPFCLGLNVLSFQIFPVVNGLTAHIFLGLHDTLTHCGLAMTYDVMELHHKWSRERLS